jgi:hypothetical protein
MTTEMQPYLSPTEAEIAIPNSHFLSPTEWIALLANVGAAVAFRRLDDIATPPHEVPEDYSGWFIQFSDHIEDSLGGIMFRGVIREGLDLHVWINLWSRESEPDPQPLWSAFVRGVAKAFPEARVSCGNCKLTASQWASALEKGTAWLEQLFCPTDS